MKNRLAPALRSSLLLTCGLCAGLASCRQGDPEPAAGGGSREQPVFCYQQLDRPSPGVLHLREPVDCQAARDRYRAEGRRDRPAAIDYLTAAGLIRMSYRVGYGEGGRPVFEERVLYQKPSRFSLYNQGDKISFTSKPGQKWEVVRIRTDLDERGRPVRMEKFVGPDRAYTVLREFDGQGEMVVESTLDGAGRLKIRSTFTRAEGLWHEVMQDGAGRGLLERDLPKGKKPGDVIEPTAATPGAAGADGGP